MYLEKGNNIKKFVKDEIRLAHDYLHIPLLSGDIYVIKAFSEIEQVHLIDQEISAPTSLQELHDMVQADYVNSIVLLDTTPVLDSYYINTSEQIFSTNVLTTVSQFRDIHPILANKTYLVKLQGTFQSAATTTGMAIALSSPGAQIQGVILQPITATTSNITEQILTGVTSGATTGVRAANTPVPFIAQWVLKQGNIDSFLSVMMRSELNGSPVTLAADCVLTIKKIN